MADFEDSKKYGTSTYPVHAKETSGIFKRVEPMLTPEKLISRFLKGIPLTFRDGSTLDSEELKDRINLAANEFEVLTGLSVSREVFKQKFPFDRRLYQHYMHFRTEHTPIISLERMSIQSADDQNIFNIPQEWIETSRFAYGQVNVIPLLSTYVSGGAAASGSAGIALLSILENAYHFVPAFWELEYTSGVCAKDGTVPMVVNQLIGAIAAIEILSEKAADDANTSVQISQDGISQMTSSPGAAKYQARIDKLEEKKEKLIAKLKGIFARKYFIGNI